MTRVLSSSRIRGPALFALLLVLAACSPTRESWRATWVAPYAEFDAGARADFGAARARWDDGRWQEAWVLLSRLSQEQPDNLEISFWLQDVELALLTSGLAASVSPELATLAATGTPTEVMRVLYQDRLRAAPSVASYVLAARMEPDAPSAENYLNSALELDPRCAWAFYGKAHAILLQKNRLERWSDARAALAQALEFDPSHLRARRLEGWMHAQSGAMKDAAFALETWLVETQDDARVGHEERVGAELDLAIVRVRRGHANEAKELLLTLEGESLDRARRLATLAVAEQELGDGEAALDAARRAEDAMAGSLLAIVQQALLYENDLSDPEAAEAQWQRVVDRAAGEPDLAAMLQILRARVELERSEARKAQNDRPVRAAGKGRG